MYFLGHIGPTVALARAVDRGVDARWAALLAVAPDIIDKPVAWLTPVLVDENTRGFGHSLVGAFCALAVLLLLRRRTKTPLLLWCCWLGHLVLDRMWLYRNPAVLFWPLLGPFPPPVHGALNGRLMVWNVWGEVTGLLLIAGLAARHRLFARERLADLLRRGRLA